jgi:hypothetical protein
MIWLSYLLKTMVIQLFAFVAYRLLFDREPLGHWKRAYLLGSLLLSLVIPLLTVPPLFTRPLRVLAAINETRFASAVNGGIAGNPELFSSVEVYTLGDLLWPPLIGFYTIGVLIFLLRMGKALWSVASRLSAAVSKQQLASGVWLVGLAEPVATHTFLGYVFFQEAAPPAKEVLLHELAHARQWHSLDRLFVGALRVVFWFNPLLIYYERAIRINHELLADQAVLRQGIDCATYQQQLLNALRRPVSQVLSSGVDFYLTKKRCQMMYLSEARGPRVLVKLLTAGLLWVVLLFSFGQLGYAQTAAPPPEVPKTQSPHPDVKQAVPTAKQLAAWRGDEDNRLHIDHRLVNASALEAYEPADFSQYYVLKAPPGSAKDGLFVYLFTEEVYPWPSVPPPPPPLPPVPPGPPVKVLAAPPAPPAPPTPPGMTPPPPPAPPGSPPPLPPIDWNKFKEKMPSAAQLKEWRDRGQFGVWIDQDKIKNTDLTNYSPENFSYFNVSKLMKNAKNYGKYTYQVNLMTKEQLAKFRRQQKH